MNQTTTAMQEGIVLACINGGDNTKETELSFIIYRYQTNNTEVH